MCEQTAKAVARLISYAQITCNKNVVQKQLLATGHITIFNLCVCFKCFYHAPTHLLFVNDSFFLSTFC